MTRRAAAILFALASAWLGWRSPTLAQSADTPMQTPLVEIEVTALPTRAPQPRMTMSETALLGTPWTCKTYDGTTQTHVFSRDDSGTVIAVNTIVNLPGGTTANLHERYRYDDTQGLWNADIANGTVRATSPGWTDNAWIFEGAAKDRQGSFPVRMTYYLFGLTDYRREFQRRSGSDWTTYAGENCHRSV